MDRTIIFWGSEDDEYLTHNEMDNAIESMLDGIEDLNALPETIEVCGYARREPNVKHEAANAIERLIEGLDEEYGNPDGGYTEYTDSMKAAAETFVTAVLEEFTSWSCDLVKRETVNTQKWIKENCPDWLEENSNG